MKFKISPALALIGIIAVAACSPVPPIGQAYWQRVEDNSALYMTGPKAQQTLDEDIAGCVRVIDEMVELDALRETLPPDTHSEYHRALKASGDLAFYDTPTRYGDKKVAHSDYHDYEGCMRTKGWERVKFVRYQTSLHAKKTDHELHQYWKTGLMGDAADAVERKKADKISSDYAHVNQ